MRTLFCFLLLGSQMLLAQDLKWHDGAVVMASGVVVRGHISMTPGQSLILFRPQGDRRQGDRLKSDDEIIHNDLEVIPAHRLKSVFFYDASANVNRRYAAVGDQRISPGIQLYEVVLQGRVDVLRFPRNSYDATEAKDFDYYCRVGDQLLPLWKFHREIYSNMDQASRQRLTAFVKANNLQRGDDANVIAIIGYYNKWVRGEETLARY